MLGLIHVNKSGNTDPLTSLMGSRAFTAMARSVLYAMTDPDDQTGQGRLLGLVKANLGRLDVPTLTYQIEGRHVAEHEDGPVWAGKTCWHGATERTISEAVDAANDTLETRSTITETVAWLDAHLRDRGGIDASADVKDAAKRDGVSPDVLKKAARRLKVIVVEKKFPRRTWWQHPAYTEATGSDDHARGGPHPLAPTDTD